MTTTTSRSKSGLAADKLELLALLLQEEGIAAVQSAPLAPRKNPGEPAPLSFAQQRLWLLHQLEPESPAYNIRSALRLRGPVGERAEWETYFNYLVQRHEALRTTFITINGEPYQVVSPDIRVSIPVVDLTIFPAEEREERARQQAVDAALCPFDLAVGPLIRITLLRLGQEDHILLMVVHHIIADGWSMNILIREISTLRAVPQQDQRSPLPNLPVQYADFAQWQRQWLQGDVLEKQLSYWRQQLKDAPDVLALPTDHPRQPIQMPQGAIEYQTISPVLGRALKDLSGEQKTTLFMTLLTALNVLFYRYSDQNDILIGIPAANRDRVETQNVIGFFVNTLVIRSKLADDLTFLDLLNQVRQTTLDAYSHQDLPFEKLVQELSLPRDLSHHPLFQVIFSVQEASLDVLDLEGLTLEPWPIETSIAKFDMTVIVIDRQDELTVTVEYRTDVYEGQTIQRMLHQFQRLLENIVDDPTRPISALSLLNEAERRQILVEWNDTVRPYPHDCTLSELFEAQVVCTPEATAVSFGERELSYEALNGRANQLAHRLRSLGVGPDVLVGLWMERSIEMIVGILGILKAGGAYLPLDPTYPTERLVLMIEDAGIPVLVSTTEAAESLPEAAVTTVYLDENWSDLAQESKENPEQTATAQNLAYVMYTSGSTGQPKGVCISQQAINRLVFNTNYVHLDQTSRIAQASNASFDAATFEIWGALLHGGQLIGIEKEAALSALDLSRVLRDKGITTLFLTTALFNQIARQDSAAFQTLTDLFFGGELVDPASVKTVTEGGSPDRLVHVYGPTESTTFATWQPITQVPEGATNLPIGFPLTNTQIYVLDRFMQPVPVGMPGELYIGGDGLARGYLNRPALTAERFIPHPYSETPGGRLYVTGDLVVSRPDGSIEFLGRNDDQVKMRGYRIELGEINLAVEAHPAVKEAAILLREDIPGDKRIVGYVVTEDEAVTDWELQAFLHESLPAYMVPSAFVMLDALPLNPNGKIDRRNLPRPEHQSQRLAADFVPPRTHVEQLLAQIWCEVLSIPEVSIDANFFELGGHSLLATQVTSGIQAVFNVALSLWTFFESATIRELAPHVEAALSAEQGLFVPPLQPVEHEALRPLSFAQQRLWFIDQLTPNTAAYNVPHVLRIKGHLDSDAVAWIFNQIVQRHETLRTTFVAVEGTPYQKVAPELNLPLPVIDLQTFPAEAREAEAWRLAHREARRPFDLAQGPLIRTTLLQLDEADYMLLLTMHHIISDGWSVGVFVQEVAAFAQVAETGESSLLPDLPIQYADFAAWQNGWLQGEALERLVEYWRGQLGHDLPVLALPLDKPRPQEQTFQGGRHPVTLSAKLTTALKTFGQQEGVTLFTVLLAAFKVVLHYHAEQVDIVVGTDVANRNRVELEGLIGFFVNQLALRTDLSGDPDFREVLQRVHRVSLDAFTHQDLPFDKLIEVLNPQRNLSHTPVFQAKFVLQAPLEPLQIPGLSIEFLESDSGTAKFDLLLNVWETNEGLRGLFMYSKDIFNDATTARMLAHFETVLQIVTENPQTPLSAFVEKLAAADKAQATLQKSRLTTTSKHKLQERKRNPVKVKGI